MKKLLLSVFIFFNSISFVSAQCSTTPVKEAVRNGDFEAGYLTGSGTKHTATSGSDFDFYSDMDFKGQLKSGAGAGACNCCQYGMGDGYAVAKAETFTCASTNYVNNTYYGMSYGGDKNFNDHTAGLSGKGHALLVDLNTRSISPKTGGLPIAWEQTVDIYPSQNYWFSAYVANFSTGTAPVMQVTIIPRKAGVDQTADKITLPVTGAPTALMSWTQMTAQWSPTKVFDQATIRFEFVNVSGGSSGLDVAIDDISFINSCQNFASQKKPTFPADSVNLCSTAGSATLTATYPTSGNETITWFEGTGATQTVIAGVTGLTHTVSQPGTYRICVQDPDNSCATNATVVVYKEMKLTLPASVNICDETQSVITALTLTPSGTYTKNYTWTVPTGVTNPGNVNSVTATKTGAYSLTVTNPAVTGCSATATSATTATKTFTTTNSPSSVVLCSPPTASIAVNSTPSSSLPKTYVWTVPTGATAPGNSNSATASVSGTYSVVTTIDGRSECTSTSTTTVTSSVPVPKVKKYCSGGGNPLTLAGVDGKNYAWSTSSTMSPLIGSGSSVTWNVPNGTTGNQTLYMQSTETTPLGTGGPTALGSYPSGVKTLTFTTTSAVKLTSLNMSLATWAGGCNAAGTTTTGTVSISGSASFSTNVTFNCGSATTINPNWTLPAGTYTLTSDKAGYFAGNPGTTNIGSGVVSITSSGETMFGSLTFEKSAACDPLPVTVSDSVCCTQLAPTVASAASVCQGATSVTLTATKNAATTGTITYQWYNDAGKITGATSSTYSVVTTSSTAAVNYWATVTSSGTCSGESPISNKVIVTINPKPTTPTITVSPNQSTFCAKTAHTLTAASTVTGGGALTYTWKLDGTSSTSTQTGLTANTADNTYDYKVVVSTAAGCKDSLTKSITITALDSAKLGAMPSLCPDDAPYQLSLGSGATAGGAYKDSLNTTNKYVSATGLFTPTGLADGKYKVTYTTTGTCPDTDSDYVIVTKASCCVQLPPTVAGAASVCQGAPSVTLTATKNAASTGTIVYQWYNDAGSIAGATSATYTVVTTTATAAVNYWATVTSSGTCSGESVISNKVIVSINAKPTTPTITVNPNQTIFCAKTAHTLTAASTITGGVAMNYNWLMDGTSTTATQTGIITSTADNTYDYKVVVSTAAGCKDSLTQSITVNPLDSAKFGTMPSLCSSDAPFQLNLGAGATPGGAYKDSLNTTNKYVSATGLFTPTGLVDGKYKVTYTTTGACPDTDSDYVTVTSNITYAITTTKKDYCKSDGIITLGVDKAGGTIWTKSGTGVVNASARTFDVNLMSAIDTVFYGKSGACGDTVKLGITVSPNEVASIDSVTPVCSDAIAFDFKLSATSTSGGTWSGTGITSATLGTFNAVTAGTGWKTIKYQTPGGCFVRDSVKIWVKPRLDATVTMATKSFCGNAAAAQASAAQAGGVWTWRGAGSPLTTVNTKTVSFDPSKVTTAGKAFLVYKIDSLCGDADSVEVTVSPVDIADITTTGTTYCQADAAVTLALSATTTPGGTWSGPGITSSTLGTFSPSSATVGNNANKIYYTTNGLCPVKDSLIISVVGQIVTDLVSGTATDSLTPVCANAANIDIKGKLTATSTAGGTWSSKPAGAVNSNGQFLTSMAIPNTVYSIKYTVLGGTATCRDSDSVFVRVLPILNPTISNEPSATQCINNSTFDFNTSGDAGGVWSISGAGSINSSTGVVNLSTSGAGTFTVTYTHGGTCPSSDNATITIESPIDATINPAGPFCENLGTQSLSPVVAGGTWSGTGVDATGNFNPSTAGAGSYIITYTQTNSCVNSSNITIDVNPLPIIDVQPDITGGCEPQTVIFTDASSATATSTQWTFEDGTTASDLGSTTKIFNGGCYGVSISQTFSNGCTSSRSFTNLVCVDDKPTPDFIFAPERATVLDPNILFTNTSGGGSTYEWDFGRDAIPSTSQEENPFVGFVTEQGDTFNVCLTAMNGACTSDPICKDVIILNNVSVYVPNSFTPNGDGLNDVFYPNGKFHDNPEGLDKFEFVIYNRWGELIFKSNTPYQGWDGTVKSNFVQTETYVWKLTVWDMANMKEIVTTGTVTRL